MRPCISQATTLSTSFEDDLTAFSSAGFDAVELWLTKLEDYLATKTITDARDLLAALNLEPLAAASQGGIILSGGRERQAHLDVFRRRLGWLAELGTPTMIVGGDFVLGAPSLDDYRRAAASIAEVAEIARGAGVRLALEFQKGAGLCTCLETAMALISDSGADDVGVCLDVFHFYTGPSKFEDLAYLTKENLAWVQVSDLSATPRELAGDSSRIFPGEGDFQLGPILDHLAAIGYDGGVSLEVLNPALWAAPASHLADVAIQSLVRLIGDRGAADHAPSSRGA